MDRREKTKYTGVYKLVSSVRRYDGKPDICFYIYYKSGSKLVKEKVGWLSEQVTAGDAADLRAKRVRVDRHGEDIKKRSPGPGMTYAEAWEVFKERWLPTLKRPEEEKNRYRLYIEPVFAGKALDAITTLALQGFKQGLADQGYADATVRHILGDIRRVYRKMAAWELYSGPMPMDGITLPKPDNARQRYLTPDEARSLMDALKPRSIKWWRIAMISLHTGMRLSEVMGLRGSDLDFPAGVVHVRDAKTGTRMAHMTKTVKTVLKELAGVDRGALLFATTTGQPMRASDTSKTFARVVNALDLNKGVTDRRQQVVFHSLRHTFCSWLAIRGVPLYTIGELVGHSDVEMTKRYAHLCPDTKRQAVNEVDAMSRSRSGEKANATHASPAGRRGSRKQPSAGKGPLRRPSRKPARRPGSASSAT